MNENQKVINSVNGNVMMWLCDRLIDDEEKSSIERALAPRCEKCGVKEVTTWFPKYKKSLTDGLCPVCLDEYNGEKNDTVK